MHASLLRGTDVASRLTETLTLRPHGHESSVDFGMLVSILSPILILSVMGGTALFAALRRNKPGRSSATGPGLFPPGGLAGPSRQQLIQYWTAAGPLLEAIGMSKLDAESYTANDGDLLYSLYLRFEVKEGAIHAWYDCPCPEGAPERFMGDSVRVSPGGSAGSGLHQWVMQSVGEALGPFPRGAVLTVKAPEIPGDACKLRIESPFLGPEIAPAAARLLKQLMTAAGGKPKP